MNQPYFINHNILLSLNINQSAFIKAVYKSINFSRLIDFCVKNMDCEQIYYLPQIDSGEFDASEGDLDDSAPFYMSNVNYPKVILQSDCLRVSQHYAIPDMNTCEQHLYDLIISIDGSKISLSIDTCKINNADRLLLALTQCISENVRMHLLR